MLEQAKIAFIGAGNMSEALIKGLLTTGALSPDRLLATDILEERRGLIEQTYRVRVGKDNRDAVRGCNVIVLSVEPQVLDEVLDEVSSAVDPEALLISVAAGYPIARIAGRVRRQTRIVRVMPNTPSSILQGVSALSFSEGWAAAERDMAVALFESVGTVVTVEEHLMDAVTGLSGSGPAYVYLMIEALADGGVKMGLSRALAELLAAQTVAGAAHMLIQTGEHPGQLKDRIASPGGTTIAGLHRLEAEGLRGALISTVAVAAERSGELGLG